MKIYFDGIIYSWQKSGGVYRYFNEIITGCSKNNNTETILLIQEPNYKYPTTEGIKIEKFGIFFKWTEKNINYVRKFFTKINQFRINKYLSDKKDGVFHSTYYTTYNKLKIPQVVTVHDMTHEKFPIFFNSQGAKRFINKKKECINKADAIICVSQATKNSLLKIYNIDEKKIFVVYHGISRFFLDDNNIKNNFSKSELPYILFIGKRGLYKNFSFFINTFAKWNNRNNYNIILTGDELTDDENKLVHDLGLDNNVICKNLVDEEELRVLYKESEFFIFPSLDEGFGLPILEAISSRTKVLCSNIEVFKEIGEDMVTYFDPTDEASLLNGLEKITNEKITTDQLEERADRIRKKFSWEKCINETVNVYKKINDKKNY